MFRWLWWLWAVAAWPLTGQTDPADHLPDLRLGVLRLRPSGFLEATTEHRSAVTGDSISTRFGQIPLAPSHGETLTSLAHSRVMLDADAKAGDADLHVYLESDFLNTPGQAPYRWRQYWGQVEVAGWQVLGGKAWSLLRPNRSGIRTESGLMNTRAVDPAYHVGLAGRRKRQIRALRDFGEHAGGTWAAAAAYDEDRDLSIKSAYDRKRFHGELVAIGGRDRRRAVSAAAIVPVTRRIDWVSQQFWSQNMGAEALGTLPGGIHGQATIQGVEARAYRRLEVFAYGGLVYGARSGGNRVVRQWSAGAVEHLYRGGNLGDGSVAFQYSQLDRSAWSAGHGDVNLLFLSFRHEFFRPR